MVTVDGATVTGLRKKTATITYLIRIRNTTGKIAWAQRRSSWAMKGVGLSAAPQQITPTNSGKTLRLTFTWPRKRLISSSLAVNPA
ncbi:MAG: hypothetical protein ACO3DD_02830, partial [Burkholderiaceae bacterium]